MISYLVRYNWSYVNGLIKEDKEYEGMAYNDMIPITLDDIMEQVLIVSKEYNIPYKVVMEEMYYPDVTILYAKYMNEVKFTQYDNYVNMSEESKSKYVTSYGVPKPYMFELLDQEKQQKNIENYKKHPLEGMYRHGGKLND